MGTSHRGVWVLQTDDMFRDDDAAWGDGPSSQLEGLVIERNLSGEQLAAAVSGSRAAVDDADEAQLTLNAPALLHRPIPARANPMARLHEPGTTWHPAILLLSKQHSLLTPQRGMCRSACLYF